MMGKKSQISSSVPAERTPNRRVVDEFRTEHSVEQFRRRYLAALTARPETPPPFSALLAAVLSPNGLRWRSQDEVEHYLLDATNYADGLRPEWIYRSDKLPSVAADLVRLADRLMFQYGWSAREATELVLLDTFPPCRTEPTARWAGHLDAPDSVRVVMQIPATTRGGDVAKLLEQMKKRKSYLPTTPRQVEMDRFVLECHLYWQDKEWRAENGVDELSHGALLRLWNERQAAKEDAKDRYVHTGYSKGRSNWQREWRAAVKRYNDRAAEDKQPPLEPIRYPAKIPRSHLDAASRRRSETPTDLP